MAAALTVGEALKQHYTYDGEEPWDQESERWHALAVDRYPELRWTLNQFLHTEKPHRHDVLRAYLVELDGSAPYAQIEALDGHLQALANGKGKSKKSEKQAGDKWTSPGRLVCTWPDLDLTARSVLFVMAAHGRDDGTNCFVAQSTIAEYLGFKSTEPVRRAWRRLEKAGAIKQTAKATQQKPPTYRINRGPRVV